MIVKMKRHENEIFNFKYFFVPEPRNLALQFTQSGLFVEIFEVLHHFESVFLFGRHPIFEKNAKKCVERPKIGENFGLL